MLVELQRADSRVAEIDVVVYKGGREIDRVRRPLRQTDHGTAVKYRRQLWPVSNGVVNLDGPPIGIEPASGTEPSGDQDAAQQDIIERPPSDRLIVDAGPGTGKTRVACARVAALIGKGVPAARIWLISFTRTAVLEIRTRIADALGDPAAAASVSIATLDSNAWALQSGFTSGARLTGSFDQNIEATLSLVREDEDLGDYLSTKIKHLIVDEGQDIVGIRAELILAIIRSLNTDCGVTLFADEAQAIYGFTEDAGQNTATGPTLLDQLRHEGFKEASLKTVYRTTRSNLRKIFTGLRQKILRRSGSTDARRKLVESEICRYADEDAGSLRDLNLDSVPDSGLVLTRRRFDVLMLSSMNPDTPHRLRMSGLPTCLKPWLGALLWDHMDIRLTRTHFDRLWTERITGKEAGLQHRESAWSSLVEVAGETYTTVDLHRLREVLARGNPPMLFCTREFGASGPILGTIHASKGCEADHVSLYLPRAGDNADDPPMTDPEEEIRVLFVGATRARECLRVGSAFGSRAGSAAGRVWRWAGSQGNRTDNPRIQIEVGRSHDLSTEGLVGRRIFQRQEDALAVQMLWRTSPVQQSMHAYPEAGLDWDFLLQSKGNIRLGALGPAIADDLKKIAQHCRYWPPPKFLPYLRSLGARTMVMARDDPRLDALHHPWRVTGFLTAPLLTGLSLCTFPGD